MSDKKTKKEQETESRRRVVGEAFINYFEIYRYILNGRKEMNRMAIQYYYYYYYYNNL